MQIHAVSLIGCNTQFDFSHKKKKIKATWNGVVKSYVITMEFYLFQIVVINRPENNHKRSKRQII